MDFHRSLIGLVALVVLATLAASASAQQSPSGDPTGFVDLLNAARAARGLSSVAYDPTAAAVAAQNNAVQSANGLGHHVVGAYGQVAAVGMLDAASALRAWSESPAHAALIYAPDLVAIGYHQFGMCHTASTRQGGLAMPTAPAMPMPRTTVLVPTFIVPASPFVWTYPVPQVRWLRVP